LDPDRYIRNIACEGFGRLCNNFGNTFTTTEINNLIDTIVLNRDPNSRAACATALGSILAHVGGMAAGYHLKKIHSILMSLCSDPSPSVHHSAIEALSQVADSAGLTFSGNVLSTLGLLAQLWTCDTHNEESGTIETSNCELDMATRVMIARCVDSLVNVLGPDLQDMSKARELIMTLIYQFKIDEIPMVQVEGLKALEHIYRLTFANYRWISNLYMD
jgi:HEAT repeat-containing protein 5